MKLNSINPCSSLTKIAHCGGSPSSQGKGKAGGGEGESWCFSPCCDFGLCLSDSDTWCGEQCHANMDKETPTTRKNNKYLPKTASSATAATPTTYWNNNYNNNNNNNNNKGSGIGTTSTSKRTMGIPSKTTTTTTLATRTGSVPCWWNLASSSTTTPSPPPSRSANKNEKTGRSSMFQSSKHKNQTATTTPESPLQALLGFTRTATSSAVYL